MTPREIAALLAYIGRLDPRLARSDQAEAGAQIDQWQELLADVPMATPYGWDARTAAREHYQLSPYPILPADIGRPWTAYKRDRIQRHHDPLPSADPEDSEAWAAELVRTRAAVATGTAQPAPLRQLVAAPEGQQQERRRAEGESCIPPAARHLLARFRPALAAREAAVARGEIDILGVDCEQCGASAGRPCRVRRIEHGFPRGTRQLVDPHACRRNLAHQRAANHAQQPTTV
ncbi:hypothetical protein [Streptomyces sp. GZWMJZ-114]|uniref:zinc finger domain-containing protein n=1 Tax=Streptomyces sp. GZWMJZ-114 TaxID=2494734 RepID=UPI001011C460|nr:hypothetical protein [Streptomyces sp. GZWMJZ-114]